MTLGKLMLIGTAALSLAACATEYHRPDTSEAQVKKDDVKRGIRHSFEKRRAALEDFAREYRAETARVVGGEAEDDRTARGARHAQRAGKPRLCAHLRR